MMDGNFPTMMSGWGIWSVVGSLFYLVVFFDLIVLGIWLMKQLTRK